MNEEHLLFSIRRFFYSFFQEPKYALSLSWQHDRSVLSRKFNSLLLYLSVYSFCLYSLVILIMFGFLSEKDWLLFLFFRAKVLLIFYAAMGLSYIILYYFLRELLKYYAIFAEEKKDILKFTLKQSFIFLITLNIFSLIFPSLYIISLPVSVYLQYNFIYHSSFVLSIPDRVQNQWILTLLTAWIFLLSLLIIIFSVLKLFI